MLEYFVHVDPNEPPNDLVVVIAEVPDNISRFFVSGNRLPKLWRQTPVLPELKTIGDDFVQQGEAAILVVPSALAPVESNWLINPLHPDFRKIRIRPPEPFDYDSRFFTETK